MGFWPTQRASPIYCEHGRAAVELVGVMTRRFLPDCSYSFHEASGEGTLRGLEEKKDMGNKCARMWDRRHIREGCHRVLSAHVRFMMRISREAGKHSGVFVSSHVWARPGVER